MSTNSENRNRYLVPEHQPDAYLIQANPVSGQKYVVLDTTKSVRIIGLYAKITWETTQPTLLEVYITIDGQPLKVSETDPVSGDLYHVNTALVGDGFTFGPDYMARRAFLIEGRSVKIEVAITWVTTQPTPLVCRVKYAKIGV